MIKGPTAFPWLLHLTSWELPWKRGRNVSPGAGSARQPTVMKTCGKVIDLFHFIESIIVNMSCRLLLCVVSVKKRVTTGQGLLESTEKNPDPPKPIPVPRQKKRCCFFFIRLSRKKELFQLSSCSPQQQFERDAWIHRFQGVKWIKDQRFIKNKFFFQAKSQRHGVCRKPQCHQHQNWYRIWLCDSWGDRVNSDLITIFSLFITSHCNYIVFPSTNIWFGLKPSVRHKFKLKTQTNFPEKSHVWMFINPNFTLISLNY